GWAQGNNDRKDLHLLIKAFCEEFSPTEEVKLLVKINNAYQHPNFDYNQALHALVPSSHAELVFNSETVKTEVMPYLYAQADVFCCISRAEAFGLTYLEAMACGLPCIATKYSGYLDFLNDENSWLIDGEMKPATDQNPLYEGINWCFTNVNSVRKALRNAFQNKDLVAQKAKKSLETSQNFTWKISAQKLKKIIEEV
ncbi:MAG: glycosyltransferase, partial [Nanoarchaeota archaeon]